MYAIVISVFAAGTLPLPPVLAADCGWVLWRKASNLATQGRPDLAAPNWTTEAGFDDLRLCSAAAVGSLTGKIEGLTTNRIIRSAHRQPVDSPIATLVFSDKSVVSVGFVCFPGGFDPRNRS